MSIRRVLCALGIILVATGPVRFSRAADSLKPLAIDLTQTTVSGLSSGAFMAVQFHVAFSGTVRGVGAVAGGPFYCAQGQLILALYQCMQTYMGAPDPAKLLVVAHGYSQQGKIDPLDALGSHSVYLFTGTNDNTVTSPVVDTARRFYLLAGVPAANLEYRHDVPSGHAMITDNFGNACSTTMPPYIDNCNYDQAGDILKRLYPNLKPRANQASGTIIEFDQTEFFGSAGAPPSAGPPPLPGGGGSAGPLPFGFGLPALAPTPASGTISMNDAGFVYVPNSCASGVRCKIHVVFHGCKQTVDDIQDVYVKDTGYNTWAESNDIVVLYPQIKHDPIVNPNGCWDWWGYTDSDYSTKNGVQMAAIRAMLKRLAGN